MRPRHGTLWIALAAAVVLVGAAAAAQEAGGDVRVGLYDSPPFVMREATGARTGMAIDLWERIAEGLDLTSDYVEFGTLRELTDATANGAVDIAVTNMTITRQRAQRVDFTQPWFDAGLRIMVPDAHGGGFAAVWQGLASAGHLRAYGWLAGIIVAATLMLTLFDRRFDPGFPRRWRDGLAEGFYSVMSVVTSGRTPARKNLFGWAGRVFSALWLVCGIGVLAYVTSSVTSVMTTLAITGTIDGPDDLSGHPVGVFSGSVAESFANASGFAYRPFPGIEAAADAPAEGRVDAIVADAPVLEYYAHSRAEKGLDVVGPIFEPDKYGFGLPLGSALTKPLTVTLLGLKEDGVVDGLRAQYFGDAW